MAAERLLPFIVWLFLLQGALALAGDIVIEAFSSTSLTYVKSWPGSGQLYCNDYYSAYACGYSVSSGAIIRITPPSLAASYYWEVFDQRYDFDRIYTWEQVNGISGGSVALHRKCQYVACFSDTTEELATTLDQTSQQIRSGFLTPGENYYSPHNETFYSAIGVYKNTLKYIEIRSTYTGTAGIGFETLIFRPIGNLTVTASWQYGGHFYQFYNYAVQWNFARNYALLQYLNTRRGYLVNVNSAGEQAALISAIGMGSSAYVWLGASDAFTEGVWIWSDGPESGQQFASNRTTVNGAYCPWAPSTEPDNAGIADNCLQLRGNGYWYDVKCFHFYNYGNQYGGGESGPVGFVVEFLGIPQCTTDVCSATGHAGNLCTDNNNGTYYCTCGATGYIPGPGSTSCIQQCTSVPTLGSGRTLGNCAAPANPGYTCTTGCAPGYAASGNLSIACGPPSASYGSWSNPSGTCAVAVCVHDECRTSYNSSNICTNNNDGTWTCTCKGAGWQSPPDSRSCIGPQQCLHDECSTHAVGNICRDTYNGTYTCNCAAPGWSNGTGTPPTTCTAPAVCNVVPAPCATTPANASNTCIDYRNGSYSCSCLGSGWTAGTGAQNCIDVNECSLIPAKCSPNATCMNSPGSFNCTCNTGYSGTGLVCTDIDACKGTPPICFTNVTCTDLPAPSLNFTCGPCPQGYSGDGRNCTLINWCAKVPRPCDVLVTCNNTLAGPVCSPCPSGYNNSNGTGVICVDIDECQNVSSCVAPGVCMNTIGSYFCAPIIAHGSILISQNTTVTNFTLNSVTGGQVVAFNLSGGSGYTLANLTYGPPSRLSLYSCRSFNVTGSKVSCTVSRGVGANLTFQVLICAQSNMSACRWITVSSPLVYGDAFHYPPPVIFNNTLQHMNGGVPSSAPDDIVDAENPLGESLRFAGDNFIDDPSLISVYYGRAGLPMTYQCLVQPQYTTTNFITCLTSATYDTLPLLFTVVVPGYQVTGFDSYQTIAVPNIEAISGCTPSDVYTINCPTKGGIPITIYGGTFYQNSSILVAGTFCPTLSYNQTQLVCSLPPGAGQRLAVTASYLSRFSSPVLGISYASPNISSLSGCPTSASPLALTNCSRLGNIITIMGTYFGLSGAIVLVGGSQCGQVTHNPSNPDGYLTCNTPSGTGQSLSVIVFQQGGAFSLPATLSYAQCPPGTIVSDINCTDCPMGKFTDFPDASQCVDCDVGSMSNHTGSSSCVNCPIGYYADSVRSALCQPCPMGLFNPAPGQAECSPCPSGQFTNQTGQSVCMDCELGRYQPNPNSSVCELCMPGSYAPTSGREECLQCGSGSIAALSGSSECTPCPAGTYQGGNAGSNCTNCSAGYYSDQIGRADCLSCETGRAASFDGATTCDTCFAGFSAQSSASIACVPCASGYYTDANNQVFCTACPLGSASVAGINGSKACTQCAPGYYSEQLAQPSCLPCIVGSYSDASAQTGCKTCAVGKYAGDLGSSTCLECPAGSYQSFQGIGWCYPCATGSYSQTSGRSECNLCTAGYYASSTNASSCDICKPGYYTAMTGASYCQSCQPGYYQLVAGEGGCNLCVAGTYSTYSGASQCDICSLGYYSTGGTTGCTACSPGSYAPQPASSECQPCSFGYHANTSASVNCTACESGFYLNVANGADCIPCEAGYYNPSSAQTSCLPCAIGLYAPDISASNCTPCPPGTFQKSSQGTECTNCPVGTSSNNQSHSAACVQCGLSEIAAEPGLPLCKACPLSTTADDLRIQCNCPSGQFSPPPSWDETCSHCLSGAVCDRVGLSYYDMGVARGYWRAASGSYYLCSHPENCLGIPSRQTNGSDVNTTLALDNQCAPYKVGPLCAICAPGYREEFGSQTCAKCPPHTTAWASTVLVSLVILLGLFMLYGIVIRLGDQAYHRHKKRLTASENTLPINHFEPKEISSYESDVSPLVVSEVEREPAITYNVKILIGFCQIVTSLINILSVPWPSGFQRFMSAFSWVNIDFMPWPALVCVNNGIDFYWKYYATTLTPIAVLGAVGLFFYVPMYLIDRFDMHDYNVRRDRLKLLRVRCLRLIVFTIFLIYPGVSSKVLSYFLCEKVENVYYLIPDFHERCNSEIWTRNLPFAIIMVFVYPVAVPVVFFGLLYRNRNQLMVGDVRYWLGFLYEGYMLAAYWFEMVDLIHKLLLCSIIVFFPSSAILPVGLFIQGAYIAILLLKTPYLRAADDRLQMLAQFDLFLLLTVQHTYSIEGAPPPGSNVDIALSAFLILISIVIFCIFVYNVVVYIRTAVWDYKRKAQEKEEGRVVPEPEDTSETGSRYSRPQTPEGRTLNKSPSIDAPDTSQGGEFRTLSAGRDPMDTSAQDEGVA